MVDTSSNTLHALKRVNLVQKVKLVLVCLALAEAGDLSAVGGSDGTAIDIVTDE